MNATTIDYVSFALLLSTLEDVTKAAERLDADATKHGRGLCNGDYAGNVADEGCPLCKARRVIRAARKAERPCPASLFPSG